MPPPPRFSSSGMPRPASVISGPASAPAAPCGPRSIMPWGTRRWPWATYPGRSPRTTHASPRPLRGTSLDAVRARRRDQSPVCTRAGTIAWRFPRTRTPATSRSRSDRTGGEPQNRRERRRRSHPRASPRAIRATEVPVRTLAARATDRPRTSRRRIGGAGGGRSTPPGTRGDSPEDRLDAALENIRAAQSRRIPEDPPPASANDDRKDW